MSQHTWKSDNSHGGHNGEYWYTCTVCGLSDWLASYSEATPDWHDDKPCVPVAAKVRRVPVPQKVKAKKPKVKPPTNIWQVHERDQVAADWLLEHGYTPERVKSMMTVDKLEAAFSEVRPLCVQCDAPGTRQFSTEGDGNYWLCDTIDNDHGPRHFLGEPIAQPALREYLGTPEPEWCGCMNEGNANNNCERCEGTGFFVPDLDTVR